MFVTAVCVLFLIKLRWPRNKTFIELGIYIDYEESIFPLRESPVIGRSTFNLLTRKAEPELVMWL